MLKGIHQSQLGKEASKRRAREVLFWPKLDKNIEKLHQPSEPLKPYRLLSGMVHD